VASAQERNRRLLEQLDPQQLEMLRGYIDRLTATAAELLAAGAGLIWNGSSADVGERRVPDGSRSVA